MHRPFKSKSKAKAAREQIENRLDHLAAQTEGLRQQAVERAPDVRDQLMDMLPDKRQLLDLRDDLFDRLPDTVQDKLPEQVKPKRSRLKRIAVVGLITGAGAAAFAVVRGRTQPQPAQAPFPQSPTPTPAPAGVDVVDPAAEPVTKTEPKLS